MRSASSKTKYSTLLRSIYFWLIKSNNLPGVATKISTPLLSLSVWGFCLTPPYITTVLSGKLLPYASKLALICIANSLVGVKIKALIAFVWFDSVIFCNIGIANAAVLPVPVCALPIISFLERSKGMACSWIGVGNSYPSVFIDFKIGSMISNLLNDIISPSMH